MTRAYNFSAGPAALPDAVIYQIHNELKDWQGLGVSVMEVNHRHPSIQALAAQTKERLRYLLDIPDHYHILFCHGGGRAQYSMVPLNLLTESQTASYPVTGLWSWLAYHEARYYRNIKSPIEIRTDDITSIPPKEQWTVDHNSTYLHYVDNETVHGIEFPFTPTFSGIHLVCDMTSSILTKPVNVEDHALIYAACQKNAGIAGMTMVIYDPHKLPPVDKSLPPFYNYQYYMDHAPYYNTPPVFAIYVTNLILGWTIEQGGIQAFESKKANISAKLYEFIDNSEFYYNKVENNARSRINVPFYIAQPQLTDTFVTEAEQKGLFGLRGHKTLGGLRASLYNAVTEDAVDGLIQFMKDFAWRYQHS